MPSSRNSAAASADVLATVDVALLTLVGDALAVALFRRDAEPFANAWALPGGKVDADEDSDVTATAHRVLRDMTSLKAPFLEQLQVFSGPTRDPRGWSMSTAHYALVQPEAMASATLKAGLQMKLVPVSEVRGLAFDHAQIVAAAAERVRLKSAYSTLPAHLLGPEFTLTQLHAVYQVLTGKASNMASFRRKIEELDAIEPIPGKMFQEGRMRPSQLYRIKRKFKASISTRDRGLIA